MLNEGDTLAMAQSNKFWNKIAKKYAAQPISNPEDYQEKLNLTAQYLNEKMQVLEFGCGTGGTAVVHAPRVSQYRAIDVSDAMLDFGRAKAQQAGVGNILFEENTIEAIELEEASLDMMLGLSILHLLENKEAAIAKVYRALKPGGYFVSSTICLGESYRWLAWVAPFGRALGFMPLIRFFTGEQLRDSLRQAGFEIIHDWQPGKNRALFLIAQKPV
ncbi:ubiquinone/menaquinone biosynthesis C-methylase UbiE [Alteromonadaceae bacterium 2753L.S.0a.02]|nr:ubiquinone/menaquinone biosynthesis C-methylase UbiE [Alteromonadaceae bacterium 2753L.S.0a.02]